jgi:CheY-like chemotaxis protein
LDCIQPESQRLASSPCSPCSEKLFKKHFLTALVMPGDRERCLETGVNEYLSKPVRLKTLAGMIETLAEQKIRIRGNKKQRRLEVSAVLYVPALFQVNPLHSILLHLMPARDR